MLKLRKTTPGDPLIVSMTGLRSGDRVLFIGCAKPKHVALLALKPGIAGRACAVDEDPARTAAVEEAAQKEGALLETGTSPFASLPYGGDEFDAVILDHTLGSMDAARRAAVLGEAVRVLRPGGRCIVIERSGGGLAALFGGSAMKADEAEEALRGADFRGVRTLAQREGLLFVEGARAGSAG